MFLEPGVCGWEQAAAGHGQRGQAQPVRLQHHHAAKFRYVVLQKKHCSIGCRSVRSRWYFQGRTKADF